MTNVHDCEEIAIEYSATPDAPYHYVNSGLPNVYLSGVKYRVCEACKKQEADLPALKQLLVARCGDYCLYKVVLP
jgi:hypothetical protein